ncbi:MAG TPA: glycoside hydrolase family 3 N-terminal domain-containing protein [Thermoleophilaceae bacterium]
MRERLRHPSRALIAALAAAALAVAVVVALVVAGGGDEKAGRRAAAAAPPPDRPVVRRSFLEEVIPVRGGGLPGASASARIAAAVRGMSVGDKVAQTMLLGYEGSSSSAPVLSLLRHRALGGIVIRSNNYSSPDQVTALAAGATNVAKHAKKDPPLIWAPQEGGDFNALPHVGPAKAPGDVGGAVRVAAHGILASGRKLSRLDINGVLAPVVDIGTEDNSDPLGTRAFASQPRPTAQFATAAVNAYKRAGIMSAAEHFPGLGGATQSPDAGVASVGLSLAQLRKRDLLPFAAAIRAGVPAVVISNASYSTDDFVTPATLSRAVSTDLLRDEMGFRGVAIADDLSQPAITTSMSVADAAVKAIAAGSDMVYISGTKRGQEAAYRALLRAVRSGAISRARLDEAVTRVLTMKREYGLVRGTRPRTKAPSSAAATPAVTTTPAVPTPAAPAATTPAPPSTQSAAPPGH